MKTKLLFASSLLAMLLVPVSCDKNNTSPDPEPVETYTVLVENALYSYVEGDTLTYNKMLDVYQEKGFIDSHFGKIPQPIVLEKTGVPASDTAKVYASLCDELSKKLKASAEEIKKTDWNKVFGTDNFHVGLVDLTAVLPDGERVEASSLCAIPSICVNSEYKSADPNQPLQKFTVSEEGRTGLYYKAKVTINGEEYDYTATYGKNGSFAVAFPNNSSPVKHSYLFYFDKTTSGKEMTLNVRVIDSKRDTVKVAYKAD